jgi:prophage tail gpP-like protein
VGHAVNEDRFRLVVDGKDCPIASRYSAAAGVFDVPSQFDMQVGHNGLLTELLHNYCEFTPFELYVNDVQVMVGDIDELTGAGGDGTELKIDGRDRLKYIVDCEVENDEEVKDVTFAELTELAMKRVGLGDVSLVSDNLANRKAITGKFKITETVKPNTEETDSEIAQTVETRTRLVHKSLELEAGSTWWDILIPQYRRGGLFLWADVFGGFVLAQPNGKQSPLGRVLRRRSGNGESGEVTILGQPDFMRSAKPRYTAVQVLGRKGSGADGRGTAKSKRLDQEMIALLNPLEADRANGGKRQKVKTYRDDKVKTPEQADFLALRQLADSRRNGFRLVYTVSGHTFQSITGSGRLVWQPDTVMHVVDDELGIDGPMYVDDCKYSKDVRGRTQTRVSLMRCEDLIFGEEDLLNPPRTASKRGLVRIGRTEVFRPQWVKDPNWGGLPTLRGVHLDDDPSFSNRGQVPTGGTGFVVDKGLRRRQ